MNLGFHRLPKALQHAVWNYASCSEYSDEGTLFLADGGAVFSFKTSFAKSRLPFFKNKISFEILDGLKNKVGSAKNIQQIDLIEKKLNLPKELFAIQRILCGADLIPLNRYDLANQDREEESGLVAVSYRQRTASNLTFKVVANKRFGCALRFSLHDCETTKAVMLIKQLKIAFNGMEPLEFVAPDELIDS